MDWRHIVRVSYCRFQNQHHNLLIVARQLVCAALIEDITSIRTRGNLRWMMIFVECIFCIGFHRNMTIYYKTAFSIYFSLGYSQPLPPSSVHEARSRNPSFEDLLVVRWERRPNIIEKETKNFLFIHLVNEQKIRRKKCKC